VDRIAPKPQLVKDGPVFNVSIAPVHLSRRLTRTEDLFVLAHMSVPNVHENDWSLEICGLVDRPAAISFDQLLDYPRRTIEAVHECAGNPFEPSEPARQVANVKWGGVDLKDLFNGVKIDPSATHLWAYGLDYGGFGGLQTSHYRKDVPLTRIGTSDVMIAYELNGERLSSEHGFPARLVVPDFYGTNSVKWLCRLELADQRPEGIFTTQFYNDAIQGGGTKPVWAIEPESMFVSPVPDSKMRLQASEIWGWAWSSSPIKLVEVSFDGGRTWREAQIESRQEHSWQKFRTDWSPPQPGEYQLRCRATDDQGRVQPVMGARNSIYTVNVVVEH
jgi:sulfane dehydrogenase subunit SoxC